MWTAGQAKRHMGGRTCESTRETYHEYEINWKHNNIYIYIKNQSSFEVNHERPLLEAKWNDQHDWKNDTTGRTRQLEERRDLEERPRGTAGQDETTRLETKTVVMEQHDNDEREKVMWLRRWEKTDMQCCVEGRAVIRRDPEIQKNERKKSTRRPPGKVKDMTLYEQRVFETDTPQSPKCNCITYTTTTIHTIPNNNPHHYSPLTTTTIPLLPVLTPPPPPKPPPFPQDRREAARRCHRGQVNPTALGMRPWK